MIVCPAFLEKVFSAQKQIHQEREDDKKYKALSLSNHLLLLRVHLSLIEDWLWARSFAGIV